MWSYSDDWCDSSQNVENTEFLGYQNRANWFSTNRNTWDKPSRFQLSVRFINNKYPFSLQRPIEN